MDPSISSIGVRAAVGLRRKPSKSDRVRLGSREERRDVYARFQAASISAISLLQHAQFQRTRFPWLMASRAIDKLEDL